MKTTSWKRCEVFAGILPIVFVQLGLIGSALEAYATTITVSAASDTVANDGRCSLREAIAAANTDTASGSSPGECLAGSGNDIITVPAMTISLGSRLEISSSIKVVGSGVGNTVVSGGGGDRVFLVSGGQVTLQGLTIRGGRLLPGGGIAVRASTVEITNARITDNGTNVGAGGGLFVQSGATVTVRRTTIDRNLGGGAGGGGAGGIANSGNLVVRESLIAGNTSNRTGGIWNGKDAKLNLCNATLSGNEGDSPNAGSGGLVNSGYAFLNHVTITQNKGRGNNLGSFRGGGLQSSPNATTIVRNSIIANNDGRGGPNDCAGMLSSDSMYNLIHDTTACQLPPGTITSQDPQLGPLGTNGGPTRTHALSVGSPAIDKGGPVDSPIDQRGYVRSMDGNNDGRAQPDIGAYELGATADSTSSSPPCGIPDSAAPTAPINLIVR